jgi:hypothetical protein
MVMATGTYCHDGLKIEFAGCSCCGVQTYTASYGLLLSLTGGAAQDEERWEGIIAASEAEAVRHAATAVQSAGTTHPSGVDLG